MATTNPDGTLTVQSGDTLSGIYGANWKAASGYTGDPSSLAVGTVLPAIKAPTPSAPSLPTTVDSSHLGAPVTPVIPTGGTTVGTGTPPNAAQPPLQALTAAETNAKGNAETISGNIVSESGQLAGEAADTAAIQTSGQVPTLKAQLTDYNNQITTKTAALAQFDSNQQQTQLNISQQPVAMSIITGQQAEQARQSAITRASMVSEIGLLNAQVQATQGNIALATQTAQAAVDAKYAPIKEQIAIQQAQLSAIQPLLDSGQKKDAANQALAMAQYSSAVDQEIQAQKDSNTTLLSLVQGGAPSSFTAGLQGKTEAEILSTPGVQQYLASGSYSHFTNPLTGQTVIYNTKTGKATGTFGSAPAPAGVGALPDANTVTAQSGQGLYQIAQANGTDVATLATLNGMKIVNGIAVKADGTPINAGDKIILPPKESTVAPYQTFGLLSKTNFNPNNSTDSNAQRYLQQYLQGNIPSARTLGLTGPALTVAAKRAQELYNAATGNPLPPNPDLLKSNTKLIESNNKLLNNLNVQTSSINANFGLNLSNATDAKINQYGPQILNGVINNLNAAFSDPSTLSYLLQNSTLQNEAGNLLAVRNASGTTVYDKMVGAGLIPKNASLDAQAKMMKTLMQEAENVANSIKSTNENLYASVDPLQMNPDNPARSTYQQTQATSGLNFALPGGFDLSALNFKM